MHDSGSVNRRPTRSWVWPGVIAAAVLAVLLAFAGGYGPHRDELYFIAAGGHPQFGYPDQPPLVPVLLHAMWAVGGGSLYLIRLPSAVAGAVVTLLACGIAREAGGGRVAHLVAAAATGASAIVLVIGHFASTTTFDLVSSSLVLYFVVRAVRRSSSWPLLWAGIATGLGFQAKAQVAALAAALLIGVAIFGPRWVFRRWQLWAGVACAVALAVPYLAWQAAHGFPQIEVGRNIAGTAEGGRIGFIPFQLVLASPVLVPFWLPALITPWRRPDARMLRPVAFAYFLLLVAYLAADGKAYYLAGFYPALLGIGALTVERWLQHDRRERRWRLAAALVVAAAVNILVGLPLLPAASLNGSMVAALNPDVKETVGWPQFTTQVEQVVRSLPAAERDEAVIFTGNYGEASDLILYGHGLPPVYSGHNGYADWGPPPNSKHVVVVVGARTAGELAGRFSSCTDAASISNPWHLDNQEEGVHIDVCTQPARPWSQLWPKLVHYN